MSLQYQNDDEPQLETPERQAAAPAGYPLYTILLIAGTVAVFVAQTAAGLDRSILLAGFVKPAFRANHEYWRILTGATTHGGIAHIAMNCYAFYNIGSILEMVSNRAQLAIVFLLSALGGGVLSLMFMPDGTSVGASGGIVGLIGYLAIYSFRRRQFISAAFRKNILMNIGFMLVFGLVLYQVIDNFGHVGGLITGGVYGLLQIPSDPHADPREAGSVFEFIGIGAVGVYLAACAFSILLIFRIV